MNKGEEIKHENESDNMFSLGNDSENFKGQPINDYDDSDDDKTTDSVESDEFSEESDDIGEYLELMPEDEILGPDPDTGEPRVEIILDPLLEKSDSAANFLSGILIRMGLSGRIAVTIRQGAIHLEITGAEPGLVIGHRGQNLDALQHLVNRFVNQANEDMVPVTIDADDYRSRRNQQLEGMVKSMARNVVNSNHTVTTEPLTPSERRLFHIAAAQFRGIRTESFGNGFFQPIRVMPVNEQNRPYNSNSKSDNSSSVYANNKQRSEGEGYPREYPPETLPPDHD
jgi:spoIIIJ-associated protein